MYNDLLYFQQISSVDTRDLHPLSHTQKPSIHYTKLYHYYTNTKPNIIMGIVIRGDSRQRFGMYTGASRKKEKKYKTRHVFERKEREWNLINAVKIYRFIVYMICNIIYSEQFMKA